jgi:hypothetical protein
MPHHTVYQGAIRKQVNKRKFICDQYCLCDDKRTDGGHHGVRRGDIVTFEHQSFTRASSFCHEPPGVPPNAFTIAR